MRNCRSRCCVTSILFAILFLTGCVKQIRSTVPDFAQAVELTSTNVQAAFDTVNTKYVDARIMQYTITYNGTQNPASMPRQALQPGSAKVRQQLLDGLKQYASKLNGLTGSNDTDSLNKASTAVGTALTDLTKTPEFSTFAKGLPSNIGDLAATAVNALGNMLIEAKLKKDLPPLIEKMDPTIQTICNMLIKDIGSANTNPDHPSEGSGLRQILWVQYDTIIVSQNQYILHNQCAADGPINCFSPDGRFGEIQKLPALAQQQYIADQTLQQVQVTVKQLAQAHTELVKAAQTKQNLTADLGDLLAEAQRLNTYYVSLSSAK